MWEDTEKSRAAGLSMSRRVKLLINIGSLVASMSSPPSSHGAVCRGMQAGRVQAARAAAAAAAAVGGWEGGVSAT